MATQPVPIPDSDQSIWKSYAKGIKPYLVTDELGSDEVLYICPPSYVGLGINMRKEDINRDIEKNADALMLTTSGALFTPSGGAGYFKQLETLSNYIDPNSSGITITSEQTAKVNQARKDMDNAKKDYRASLVEAFQGYNNYVDKMKKQRKFIQEYQTWLLANAPDVTDYRIGAEGATSDYHELLRDVYGQPVQNMINVQDDIRKAADEKEASAGFNMATIFDYFGPDDKITQKDISYVPAYRLTGYEDRLQRWKNSQNKNYTTIEMNVTKGQDIDWQSFGHSKQDKQSGNKIWVIFNNTSSSTEEDSKSARQLEHVLQNVTFKLKIKELAAFPVIRGNWDYPNLRKNFKFVNGAPVASDYITPKAILVGYGVGLEATFKDEAKNEASEAINHFKQNNDSGLNILGFQIRGSNSSTESSSTSKSDVKFDSDNGKISIDPEANLVPVVLGVIGSKIQL
ncbi:hypothetical protein FDECE_17730 [Fusarium decemcellulare]|nr:hypothetical protein FDECE_17730 [Fusarium decemcellulare]